MISNKEFVSRVVNNLKALNKDQHISKRFILNVGLTKARFLMSQKLDELTMFKEEGIITTIPCVRMHRVTYKECDIFEFKMCKDLMKSEEKLPEGIFGKNGSGIISVSNVEESRLYNYITPNQFLNLQKRKYKKSYQRYYYIKDGYLYLPDSINELVELRMITIDLKRAEEVSSCKECSCKSYWDYDFVCPDRFLDLVMRDTLQEIGTIYRGSVEDENPNLDENQKSQTNV
jgi:hypothetical protein